MIPGPLKHYGPYADKVNKRLEEEEKKALEPEAPLAHNDDCGGALRTRSGCFYLPWGPRLSSADVMRMRSDLVGMIEQLSDMEGWPKEHRNDVLTRAIRGPLSDLMPNLAYFRGRLDKARAAAATGRKR